MHTPLCMLNQFKMCVLKLKSLTWGWKLFSCKLWSLSHALRRVFSACRHKKYSSLALLISFTSFQRMTNEMKHFSFHHSLPLPSHMFSSLTSLWDDGRGYSLIECVLITCMCTEQITLKYLHGHSSKSDISCCEQIDRPLKGRERKKNGGWGMN